MKRSVLTLLKPKMRRAGKSTSKEEQRWENGLKNYVEQ